MIINKIFSTGMIAAAMLTTAAFAEERGYDLERDDVPGYFTINSIVHAGSGCPAGTVAENISPDLKAFTLLFDSFYAEVGPGVSAREKRKNCTINLSFDYPAGFQFALVDLQVRGFVSLERGLTGLQKTSFYYQGQAQTGSFELPFSGPADQDYISLATIPFSNQVWSPCNANRALNVNTEVRIDNTRNRSGSGLMTVDSVDGVVTHLYGIAWRRCR